MMIREGDLALLYFGEGRHYIVRITRGSTYSFNEGIVRAEDLLGRCYGRTLRTHIGVEYKVMKPSLLDVVYGKFERRTQVIYPKDAALIALKAGVGPGSRVVEAGTGSGCLTAVLAYLVRPDGTIYTYEVRREFIEVARRNLRMLGLEEYVVFKEADVKSGIEERDVDAVVLDLAEPWAVLRHAYSSLRSGGVLACFLPTINQVERTVEEARRIGFVMIEAEEVLERKYKVRRGETRPELRMVGHTGYLVFARKP
ncbi:MAG: hypothetical protein DRK00_01465 [Thermoprotei archaeon]|nr:MAG: hypothetical protein DRK00_01465 [Thermoprotei archaeon]